MKLAYKAFTWLLVTPQTRRTSMVNYLLCLAHGLTNQFLAFLLFISPSPVICLRAKVSDNYKQRFFFSFYFQIFTLGLREIYEHLRILFDQQNVYNSVAVKKIWFIWYLLFELLSAEFF